MAGDGHVGKCRNDTTPHPLYFPYFPTRLSRIEKTVISVSLRIPRPIHCLNLMIIPGTMLSFIYRWKSTYRDQSYSITGSGTGKRSFTMMTLLGNPLECISIRSTVIDKKYTVPASAVPLKNQGMAICCLDDPDILPVYSRQI